MRVNGEAIHATRPWKTFGEGPTAEKNISAKGKGTKTIPYTAEDIRFSRSKDEKTLYTILMNWPSEGNTVTIKSLSKSSEPDLNIRSLKLLGYEGKVKWSRDDEGLKVTFPKQKPCEYAYSIRIERES